MRFSQSATELTTATTDALLGCVCLAVAVWLLTTKTTALWKRRLLASVFGLFGLASLVGAIAHGFDLTAPVRTAVWYPLYLLLGVAVALFVVVAVCDWRGEAAARRLLPWAVVAGCAFPALVEIAGGSFMIFLGYEAFAMLTVLFAYMRFAIRGRLAGAGLIAAGIVMSMAAAVVQASSLGIRLVVPLDHNGLYHLVQLAAILVLADGIRRGLRTPARQSE